MWWQRPIWRFFEDLREQSVYRKTLERAGATLSSLRPDFVILDEDSRQVLIVEAKFTQIEDATAERRGIQDALAYLKDASAIVSDRPAPYALVAAWNATGTPAPTEIVVSGQAEIRRAINMIVSEWSLADGAARPKPQG